MLRLRDILNFPSFYSKRQRSVREVPITITGVNNDSENKEITINGKSGKYNQTVKFFGSDIINNSLVQITCDCESFKYEFSYAVFKNESLVNPEVFGQNLIKKPLNKNKYQIPSGCKHIIALANQIIKQKSRLI